MGVFMYDGLFIDNEETVEWNLSDARQISGQIIALVKILEPIEL